MQGLAIIDVSSALAGFPTAELIQEWDDAFRSVGAAVICGHGVSDKLARQLLGEAAAWFTQTAADVKQSYSHGYYGHPSGGYTGEGVEAVAASILGKAAADRVDAVESFVFNGTPETFVKPSGEALDKPLFPSAAEYLSKVQKLRKALHRLSCAALGVTDLAHFEHFYSDVSNKDALRLAYYPPHVWENDTMDGRAPLRYGAHTDYQDLTILCPDRSDWTILPGSEPTSITRSDDSAACGTDMVPTTGGLQVLPRGADMDNEAAWLPVVIPDTAFDQCSTEIPLIINFGDFWEPWTADRWTSPVHRVTKAGALLSRVLAKSERNEKSTDDEEQQQQQQQGGRMLPARQSIVYFSIPVDDAAIAPLTGSNIESFSGSSSSSSSNRFHPDRYTPVNAGEHLRAKIARSNA